MSKPSPTRYRTTNWSIYTASLRKRGLLLIWLDKQMDWLALPVGKPSRPAVFSDAAIQFFLTIKVLFKLPLTFRRIRRVKRTRPKQAKGITRPYLDKFLAVQPDNSWGLRNRAMLLLGYELLTRRSELVALTTNDLEILDDGTMRVIIRRSKADPFGQGRIAFTSQKTANAVQDWLAWRGPDINYLFCPIYRGTAVNRDLSTTTVKRLVKSAAKAAGLETEDIDAFSGHSLRVGAAQDLLCAGYDAAAIMRAGGWKSVNILGRYLEMAEHNVWAGL